MAYIDKEETIRLLQQDYAYAAADIVKEIPEADVAPVIHGKWIEEKYKTTSSGRNREINNTKNICPACLKSNGRNKTNYCPCCGAKMDGGENDGGG